METFHPNFWTNPFFFLSFLHLADHVHADAVRGCLGKDAHHLHVPLARGYVHRRHPQFLRRKYFVDREREGSMCLQFIRLNTIYIHAPVCVLSRCNHL